MRQSSVSAATDRSVNVEAKDTHEEKPAETMSSAQRRKQRWNSWGQKVGWKILNTLVAHQSVEVFCMVHHRCRRAGGSN